MRRFAVQLPAELPRAADLATFLEEAAEALGLPRTRRDALQLCGEEVFANIALHGTHAGPVSVAIALEDDGETQRLIFEDNAPPFDPTRVAEPAAATSLEEVQLGGRGLLLVRRFSAAQRYSHVAGRNRLELRFGATEALPGSPGRLPA